MTQRSEIPLQVEMFSGQGVDNRTKTQKKRDKLKGVRQPFMFSQREMAQFGVNPHPKFALSRRPSLVLVREDVRTPAQVERDRQRQAEAMTKALFNGDSPSVDVNSDIPDVREDGAAAVFAKALALSPDNDVALVCLASLVIEPPQPEPAPRELTLADLAVLPPFRLAYESILGIR